MKQKAGQLNVTTQLHKPHFQNKSNTNIVTVILEYLLAYNTDVTYELSAGNVIWLLIYSN